MKKEQEKKKRLLRHIYREFNFTLEGEQYIKLVFKALQQLRTESTCLQC